ncbi:hypothetical protein PMAYCL1PPCAC_13668, partial [Pristionchus mayeri]
EMFTNDDIIEAINFYDTAGDGKVGIKQVGLVLRAVGLVPTESHLNKLTSSFNEESRVGVEELVPMAREVATTRPVNLDELSMCLAPFDRESNGQITLSELRHVLSHWGDKLNEKEMDVLLQGVDVVDGKVSIPIFIKHITSY